MKDNKNYFRLEIHVATNLGFLALRRKHPKRRDTKKFHKMICLR
jgi:hypothetical protein